MSDYIIGLTGGVASGKSTVEAQFCALGVFVADADAAARAVVAHGSAGLAEVAAEFGQAVLAEDGNLNRAVMRQRVFADATARGRLEAIIHPRVRTALQAACLHAETPYAIVSIPLLAEGGGRAAYPWLRRILVVDVPVEMQLARLRRRDGIDERLAQQMLAAQASRPQRLAIADDVLINDRPMAALAAQVQALDKLYRALATARAATVSPGK